MPGIKEHLLKNSKPAKWMFPSHVWTDQTMEQIIVNSVKGILLQYLQQEIPYMLKPQMELFDINEEGRVLYISVCIMYYSVVSGVISAVVLVHCPSIRLAQLIAGESNGRLIQMTEEVQHNLQNTFKNFVRLRIVLQPPRK